MTTPLYDGALLTTEESMYATYLYAIKNNLSYQATSQLLDLMKIHLPSPNCYPKSFYSLKKHMSGMAKLNVRKFCSACFDEVSSEQKHCTKRQCKLSSLSYYAVLPFEEHLQHMFSGKFTQVQVYTYTCISALVTRIFTFNRKAHILS